MSLNKLDRIIDTITELKMSSVKHNEILEKLTESVEYHIKRTDALEDLHAIMKEEIIRIRSENELTKRLLEANIKSQEDRHKAKSDLMWNTFKTIFYTLSVVGTVLLALHKLGIFEKLF